MVPQLAAAMIPRSVPKLVNVMAILLLLLTLHPDGHPEIIRIHRVYRVDSVDSDVIFHV